MLYLAAKLLVEKTKKWQHKILGNRKFLEIEKAIKEYDSRSLISEMESFYEFCDSITNSSEIGASHAPVTVKAADSKQSSQKISLKDIRHNLLEVEQKLKCGIESLRLEKDHVIFLDGIDTKPSGIDNNEYIECLKGLTEAAWSINTDFFQKIKDSKGRLRIVCLLRPDVFNALDVYNSNSRLNDNSVILDWTTTEDSYNTSDIYEVMDQYFKSQNQNTAGWDHYFPEKDNKGHSVGFKSLLRRSFQRPRDFFTAIKILIRQYKSNKNAELGRFSGYDFDKPRFTDEYSHYMFGEVKNYANFYMKNEDFDKYIKFFHYLNGRGVFSYSDFDIAFKKFKQWSLQQEITQRNFLHNGEVLLQFWYDVNVIGYEETPEDGSPPFVHWSYRDRSPINVMPKIKLEVQYKINPGISKALNIGKIFSGH